MNKPQIIIASDVKNWAWERKSTNIKKHLSDEFDIHVFYLEKPGNFSKYRSTKDWDLVLCFTPKYIEHMNIVPKEKKISGITSHPGLDNMCRDKDFNDSVGAITVNSIVLY